MPTRRDPAPPPVAIVVSRYNHQITSALLEGAIVAYASAGGSPSRLIIAGAPGAYELPALALAAASSSKFAGVLALGCIIKGETIHDRVIADAVAQGLTSVTLTTGVPVALGVLTVNTPAQARARAGGKLGNKGEEAMTALLDSIRAISALRSGRPYSASTRPDKTSRTPR